MRPFALLVTWTCYATWLPGDRRGYVSNTRHAGGGFARKVNTPGVPYTRDDPTTRTLARSLPSHPTVRLTPAAAEVVARTLAAATAARGWHVRRAAVMANHVHVLLTACPDDGEAVRRVLKGVTQAALSAAADAYVAAQPGMLAGVFAGLAFTVAGGARVFHPPEASGGV